MWGLTMNDKDDEPIRRGDVMPAFEAAGDRYNAGSDGRWFRDHLADAIAALPAVQPAPDAPPLSPNAVDASPAPDTDAKVAALVKAARNLCEQFALENPMQTGGWHGEMCQCRRCRMDQLRVALAAWEGRGNE
jgi:hypothetical protein